ncbi:MAG: hypothetical protein H0T46_12100 [Deltaproteobacteria bacterium]|nr:hypothetical protein [Deltaproteobacteria bacterium]
MVLRAEVSIIGLLLPLLIDLGPLRLGDYLGLDFGPDIAFGPSGRFVIGAQAAYEISKTLGAGARVYSLTAFDPLMSSRNNMVNGELTGRVGAVIGRVRFPVAQASNAGYAARDYGASLRLPTSWRIIGYDGWKAGVDYDYFAYEEATGDAVVHRLSLVVALGI